MSISAASLVRFLIASLATIVVVLPAGWGALALWFQTAGGAPLKGASVALWTCFSLGVVAALWQGRTEAGLGAFALVFAALLIWWRRIEPSNHRIWADDVAEMTHGAVRGASLEIGNVRNFEWRSRTDYTPRWETRRYDLDRLRSADMILSYWSGRAIAHMLVSFGFDDGTHLAFSVEIRREQHEGFSEIGGFFKEFELSVIAADERDVIRVRTNVRGEDAYLYRLLMPAEAIRSLLLGFVDEANSLVTAPRFYNTITANCTTLVYHMLKRIVGYLPLDARLLFTGYLPGYVYRVGGLDTRYPLAELRERGRITDRARRADRSPTFSADIRQGVPDGS
jgi:uncharacterized protein DUF4105